MNTTVAVVIPCRNEQDYIGKCLDSIIHCNFDKSKLEVYVCDGESTDKTLQIINKYSKEHPFIFYLNNPDKTTPQALNLGLKKSKADIKIILGAHSEIHPDYIINCVKAFDISQEIGCVGGLLENVPETYVSKIIGLAMSSGFGVGNAHFRTGEKSGFVDTVAFGAYKKEVFEKIGYFDEDLVRNQDDEFNFRVIKAGFKIYLSDAINAKYFVRGSFQKLFKQYYQYGYWKVFVNTKHKTVTTIRQLIPLLFVLYIIIGAIASLTIPFMPFLFSTVLLVYILGALFFASKKTNSLKEMGMVMYTFFILHLSYGSGYLEGIIDFILLKKKPSINKAKLNR